MESRRRTSANCCCKARDNGSYSTVSTALGSSSSIRCSHTTQFPPSHLADNCQFKSLRAVNSSAGSPFFFIATARKSDGRDETAAETASIASESQTDADAIAATGDVDETQYDEF